MSELMTRRSALALAAGSALLRAQQSPRLLFGFSLYGMRTVPYREALDHVARIGYKATELCLRPGWNTEPKLLTKADRAEIRKRIGDLGLTLSSVMENMGLGRPDGLKGNLERLKAAAEVCQECSPGAPALIETTVGGRVGAWDQVSAAMADEIGAYGKTLEQLKITLAIKAHSKNAMNLPDRLLWLADQAKSPWVKVVYDYSHFEANGLDMRKTMEQVAPRAVFVHIKDCEGRAPNHKFLLPGDGDIDYKAYVKTLTGVGYRGPVLVEVSVDVYNLPGYDPLAAVRHVWEKVSPAFA
jgi:sugar phosphate isomerase/epimerase